MTSTTARPLTAHQHVYRMLRSAILDGRLAQGSRLVQADLAAALNVSTTPVREALRDLQSEGLVVALPSHGATVTAVGLDDLVELYEIRVLVEPEVMRRAAANEGGAAAPRLRALNSERGWPDDAAWLEWRQELQQALLVAAGPTRMAVTLGRLQDLCRLGETALGAASLPDQDAAGLLLLRAVLAGEEHRATTLAARRLTRAVDVVTDLQRDQREAGAGEALAS